MIYLDTETCGLHGMPVLIQWAKDDGPVNLHEVWRTPIRETLELIEMFVEEDICGFNLAFDWFHICKIYSTLFLYPDKDAWPEEVIDELAFAEEKARFLDMCLKPRSACDLMLHARKGPYQSLMDRDDIKIRRVPSAIAWLVADQLEQRIKFDDIYFAKAKDKFAPKWKVYDIKREDGTINPDFKDIKLKFRASGALKNLYRHAFKVTDDSILKYKDIEVNPKHYPEEYGFAPFALAIAPNYRRTKDWKGAWPEKIRHHIFHWGYNQLARKYAADDVDYTRRLYIEHFDRPLAGDDDSELACMVACCRWKGYAVNLEAIEKLKANALAKSESAPKDPRTVRRWIFSSLGETEKAVLNNSTKRTVLEELATWMDDDDETKKHPAAVKAQAVLDARKAAKEIEVYDKILIARRFHASFRVIGTLSSRMSGSDGLNAQGINHKKEIRAAFTLADVEGEVSVILDGINQTIPIVRNVLNGGDFKSFEVSLAAAVFNDPELDKALLSGKKVHGLMGCELFPGTTYEEVLASEGTDDDMYDKGKKGFFLLCYGGNAHTFYTKLGIDLEIGEKAFMSFQRKYKNVKGFADMVHRDFGALRQPGGIGTKVEWNEPKQYAENALGFRRYFTLEYSVCRALFEMAENPPAAIKNSKIKVMRRERVQTAGGAVRSALYGAAFSIVAAIERAVKNHYIQSFGAIITKATQRALWNLQPPGINVWIVQPMNVHDEIMAPTRPGYEKKVEETAQGVVAKYRKQVPLLAIDWMTNISSWAGKKGDANAPRNPESTPEPQTTGLETTRISTLSGGIPERLRESI